MKTEFWGKWEEKEKGISDRLATLKLLLQNHHLAGGRLISGKGHHFSRRGFFWRGNIFIARKDSAMNRVKHSTIARLNRKPRTPCFGFYDKIVSNTLHLDKPRRSTTTLIWSTRSGVACSGAGIVSVSFIVAPSIIKGKPGVGLEITVMCRLRQWQKFAHFVGPDSHCLSKDGIIQPKDDFLQYRSWNSYAA